MTEPTTLNEIRGFHGEYRFLSNFFPSPVEFEGLTYPTVEHAYQASKTLDDGMRLVVCNAGSSGQAKHAGRSLVLRPDWEDVKLSIMRTLLRKKFYDPLLKAALLQTGDAQLVEWNYWHDQYWGKCSCASHRGEGENWLGRTLMETREALK